MDVDIAQNVIHVLVADQKPGEIAGQEGVDHLFHAGSVVHRNHVHTGDQDLLCDAVAELNGRADQLALVLVQTALLLCLCHHGNQLVPGDAGVLLVLAQTLDRICPQAKQRRQRPQQRHQQLYHRGDGHGKPFRSGLGKALGRHLRENQHQQGDDAGGNRGAVDRIKPGEQQGADGGSGDIDDIVADENGGEELVIVLMQGERPLCFFVPVLCPASQTYHIQGGKSGFRGGKESRHCQQHHQTCDHADDIRTHSDTTAFRHHRSAIPPPAVLSSIDIAPPTSQ